MGRRIEKNVLGEITRYFYDSEDIAFEYSGNGTTGNIYIHGPGIDEPLGLTQTRGKYYYHADGLGSIIGITDASASLVQSYEYDSFGNLKDQKNRIKQPYAYTGREYDRETGLYYYRARYYMPEIGRFIQEDPIKFRSGDVNFYAYVGNDPIRLTDPMGLYSLWPSDVTPYLQNEIDAWNNIADKIFEATYKYGECMATCTLGVAIDTTIDEISVRAALYALAKENAELAALGKIVWKNVSTGLTAYGLATCSIKCTGCVD